jgi:hypothetical protein
VSKELDLLASTAASLNPSFSKQGWLRKAYEAVKSQVPVGQDPDPFIATFLHERCQSMKSRQEGLEALQQGVRQFRSQPVASADVLAVNRQRVRDAGGLTDDLKKELGMETASERKQSEVRQATEQLARSAQTRKSNNGEDT